MENKKTTFRLDIGEMKKLKVIMEHHFGKNVKRMGLAAIRMLIEKEYQRIIEKQDK